jgi:hypothetical protein
MLEESYRQEKEPRECDGGGYGELVGACGVIEFELEVASESERKVLSASEDVLVIIGERRGYSEES